MPLRELQGLDGTLDWLFAEDFGDECGRNVVLNRLFELMVIQLLRHLMARRTIASGMMAGLAQRMATNVRLLPSTKGRYLPIADVR